MLRQILPNDEPLLLSYEGGNPYNALTTRNHRYLENRPGIQELLTLTAVQLRKVRLMNGMSTRIVSNIDLDIVLEEKKIMLSNQR